ncbi:hypothetical protein WJX84_011234 [Apatococcus fuscideae]|uniref:Uncharacterized protein n=1 Tax=Apatococcus fuscideae TaxID=2026836 RepID=A0AAW1SXR6_9CHLO
MRGSLKQWFPNALERFQSDWAEQLDSAAQGHLTFYSPPRTYLGAALMAAAAAGGHHELLEQRQSRCQSFTNSGVIIYRPSTFAELYCLWSAAAGYAIADQSHMGRSGSQALSAVALCFMKHML